MNTQQSTEKSTFEFKEGEAFLLDGVRHTITEVAVAKIHGTDQTIVQYIRTVRDNGDTVTFFPAVRSRCKPC